MKKIIICLLSAIIAFSFTSCVKHVYYQETSETIPKRTEATTPDTTVQEPIEVEETTIEVASVEKKFIINKNTKKYHNSNCRYVGFMNEENKVYVTSTPEKLQNQAYKPCSFCQ